MDEGGWPEHIPPKDLRVIVNNNDGKGNLNEFNSAAKDKVKNAPAEAAEGSLSARGLCSP